MESSCCPPSCSVCVQPAPTKELITDRLAWHEPFDSIGTIFGVSALDLDRHSSSDPAASISRETDFPFFENAGFLLLGPTIYDYLVWTRERVRTPVHEADRRFCILVGLVADSFLRKSNFQNFLDYSYCFAAVQKTVATVNTAEIPDEVFLSDDGLNSLPDHWLQTPDPGLRTEGRGLANFSLDWKRIRTYGHGAVTLHQIALLADKEICADGIRLSYTSEAKSRWAERALWGWLRLKFWIERTIPVMRKKRPIDVAYHALRISFPFDPPGAAALHRDIRRLAGMKRVQHGNLPPADSEKLKNASRELDGLYSAMPELQNLELANHADAEINRELRPLIQSRKYANLTKFRRPGLEYQNAPLQHDEIASIANTAVGKAAAQDRADTPSRNWYLKLWRDFERSSPAPIVTRVSRDISDQLRKERRETNVARGLNRSSLRDILKGRFRAGEQTHPGVCRAEGSETAEEWKQMRVGAATILETVTFKKKVPCEFAKAEMVIMKDQVCKTPKERAIWQAQIEDPGSDLDQLQERVRRETGEDFSLQYIQQIASKLRKRANGIKSRRG
jgi:hypothetical protein